MPECFHLVIQGKEKVARGFVEGLMVGANAYGSIYFIDDLEVDSRHLLDWFKHLLSSKHEYISMIVEDHLLDLITKGVEDQAQDLNLSVVAAKKVTSASFEFSFECFSKEHGAAIKKLLEELPEDVVMLPDTQFKTLHHPDAQGLEMYSPIHEFEYSGKGTLQGKVKKVVEIYRKASEEPLIKLEKLQFQLD